MTITKNRRRITLFLLLSTILVLLAVGKLFQLMILAPSQDDADAISFPIVERGPILDRNGKILALSTRLNSVTAWLPEIADLKQTSELLAQGLELPKEEIVARFQKSAGFVYVKRKITPTESERVRVLIEQGKLKGISLTPEFGRNYPEQELACHLIGYVGVDNIGLDGIEYTFNDVLSPSPLGPNLKEIFGNQVFLSIDILVQYMIEKIAAKALADNSAESILILVMDAKSAEILAYAALPGFDPNQYNRSEKRALQNLPVIRAYEPGSVFKVFSIASMLQLGTLKPEDEFLCNGYYEKKLPGGQVINIRCVGVHGRVNAEKILKYSCNAGAAYASEGVDATSFFQMLQRFGFGKPTELPLIGESSGILADPGSWSARTKATITFGQEISVTAVQVAQAATALANGGLLLKPILVKKIISPQGELIKEFGREPIREVLSPQVAQEVLLMMETATGEGGSARRGKVEGLRVSAKTGTSQVLDPKTGKYSQQDYIASYLGILPTDNPQLIIYVVINNPRGSSYYGSQIAAPVFKEAAEGLIDYLGIPKGSGTVLAHKGSVAVKLPGPLEVGSVMPDLTGTPKRLLLPLIREGRFSVRIKGDGFVVRQDPPAGTPLREGAAILLELE